MERCLLFVRTCHQARYTQIQRFKTPKQAIKFVKTINQTFKLQYPAIYEFRKRIYSRKKTKSKDTNFFHFADDGN